MIMIFGSAIPFNALFLPALPTLSDEMYPYIWDGRVQASGINPYRYPSDAPELISLRDSAILARMNQPSAVTLSPPGAELAFAAIWRIAPDSILAMKLVIIGAVLLAGLLLVKVLHRSGQQPAPVLIFVWNPLLAFEIAYSAHVGALLRLTAPRDRLSLWSEIGIGLLIGLATVVKLYPIILLPPLWAVRRGTRRDWLLSLSMPLAEEDGLSVSTLAEWYDIDYAADLMRLITELEDLPETIARNTRAYLNATPDLRAVL